MSCADCNHRSKTMCTIFDDIILSFADSCFMDSSKDNDGDEWMISAFDLFISYLLGVFTAIAVIRLVMAIG